MVRGALAATALALVATGCGARTADHASGEASGASGPNVATVGKDIVTVREVHLLLDQARRSFRSRGRVFPAADDPYYADLRDEAVRYLVERRLREHLAERLGLDPQRIEKKDLDFETYRAISRSRKSDETVRDALGRWRQGLEEQFAQVEYNTRYRPAKHRRSIPPELRALPKPKASCDLKDGFYPYLVARSHGCLDPAEEDVSYDIPPCPEIPAGAGDSGFTDEEVDSGYEDYVTTGTPVQDFFEALTTNREDLASAASGDGPECQPFVGEDEVSIGIRFGGRPPFSPAPRPGQSPSKQ